ncbi:MAG: ATP-binding protein [Leptolyngbyaceae cyanobacterium bins.59]|nr:ATP-binding protein [Leptolyngbyaceae cyanobacterium bins.59]
MSVREVYDTFAQQVENAHQRIDLLCRDTHHEPKGSRLLTECLNELQLALEELQVAETELRQQNDELMESRQLLELQKQRYQELFDFAPDGYIVTDRYGRIQEANQAASGLFNVPANRLKGKLLVTFIPQADRRTFRTILNQLPTIHRVQEWELLFRKRGDDVVHVSLTVATGSTERGQPLVMRWLLRDITARKQAEAQLRQTQLQNLQLIESDRLKTQFMATISHELRTPLNAILGFGELLLRRFHQQKDTTVVPLVDPILRNSRHLLSLIEGLLDFSRLQAHCLDLHLEAFDLAELATSVVSELQVLAERKALNLTLYLGNESYPVVNDRIRVRQVLVNLVSNAIKFTETGSVTLEIGELQPERILLTVRDTGIGISEENQALIFKEFWQVNQSTTRRHGGTGLGLSIVRNLVELMEGSITVESTIGEGSSLRVELPRQVKPPC